MRIRLRNKRVEKGYTQRKMAELMNITLSAYQRIESGESGWTEDHILLASDILGCGPEEIMKEGRPSVPPPDITIVTNAQHAGPQAAYVAVFAQAIQAMQQQFEFNTRFMTQDLPEMIKRMVEGVG